METVVIKVIKVHTAGYGSLESPTSYEVPLEMGKEMAKYKSYYHFTHYKNTLCDDDIVVLKEDIENPFATLDFREDFETIDIGKLHDKELLSSYIKSISDTFDKYGNPL